MNLLFRAGHIEYALGNTKKACTYWNDAYSFQDSPIKWVEQHRDLFFTYSSYDFFEFDRLNFNIVYGNIASEDKQTLIDIHKKYPTYFERAAEMDNWGLKDTAEILYENCID